MTKRIVGWWLRKQGYWEALEDVIDLGYERIQELEDTLDAANYWPSAIDVDGILRTIDKANDDVYRIEVLLAEVR